MCFGSAYICDGVCEAFGGRYGRPIGLYFASQKTQVTKIPVSLPRNFPDKSTKTELTASSRPTRVRPPKRLAQNDEKVKLVYLE